MTRVTMPEPVGKVIGRYNMHWLVADQVKSGDLLITTEQAEAYAAAKVRQALEQAATIADHQHFGGERDDDLSWTDCAAYLATQIRALAKRVSRPGQP